MTCHWTGSPSLPGEIHSIPAGYLVDIFMANGATIDVKQLEEKFTEKRLASNFMPAGYSTSKQSKLVATMASNYIDLSEIYLQKNRIIFW